MSGNIAESDDKRKPVREFTFTSLPSVEYAGRFAGDMDCAYHTHAGHELVLVTEGTCRIHVGTERLEGKTGTLFVLAAGVPQYQETLGYTRTSYVIFHTSRSDFEVRCRTVTLDREGELTWRWLEDLCDLYQAPGTPPGTLTGAVLLALLERLGQLEQRNSLKEQHHPAIIDTIELFHRRLSEPLTVAVLADHACVSASHLTALFRTHFGCGPLHYLQSLRLEHACKLLRDPYQSIGQIAHACGYADPNYFIRLFRYRFGIPPGQWRMQSQL